MRAKDALVGSRVFDALDLATVQHMTDAKRTALRRLGPPDWQDLGAAAGPVDDPADLSGRANTVMGRFGELLVIRRPQLTASPGLLPPMVAEARSRAQSLGIDPETVRVVRLRTRVVNQTTGLPAGMGELGDVVIGAERNGLFRVLTLVEVKAGRNADELWTAGNRVGQLRRDLNRIAECPLEVREHREGYRDPLVSTHVGVNDPANVRIVVVTTPSERSRAEVGVGKEFLLAEYMDLPLDNPTINEIVRRLMRHANPTAPPNLINALLPR